MVQFRIPYSQQFTPKQTPLMKLIAVVRQNLGQQAKLKDAIGAAFFKNSKTPAKIAGNTLVSLKFQGILDEGCALTDFGKQLFAVRKPPEAHDLVAKNLLMKLDGIHLTQTLREMDRGDIKPTLTSLPEELRARGFEVSDNSSDLSAVLAWLREAGVLNDYKVDEKNYARLVGATPQTLDALQNLDAEQIAFLRAMVALGVTDWTVHNKIVEHAERLYAGQVKYNWKDIDRAVLQPLLKGNFIEFRKASKTSPDARGGKSSEVKPTPRFEEEVAEPILAPLYKAVGTKNIRKIRSYPLDKLVADVRQKTDDNLRGEALEVLAIRICLLLDLEFGGWDHERLREIDVR